jgi:hypothetical protein
MCWLWESRSRAGQDAVAHSSQSAGGPVLLDVDRPICGDPTLPRGPYRSVSAENFSRSPLYSWLYYSELDMLIASSRDVHVPDPCDPVPPLAKHSSWHSSGPHSTRQSAHGV